MKAVKPLVFKKHRKQRIGKGFSISELKETKISLKEALKLGIPIDPRRRTTHEANVKALSAFLETKSSIKLERGKEKSKKGREPS